MNPQQNDYNPAEDENQGVVTTMARHDDPQAMLPGPDPDLTEAQFDADRDEDFIESDTDDEVTGDVDVEGDESDLD
ncbi:hypothetical protein [Larkinella soli]|uniref:hypothetical protein n=1 Tax=Larkinella soli TaxID=1770527 RepID=UPI000FFB1452|nr:hypothetical protein [Larkinella soli]